MALPYVPNSTIFKDLNSLNLVVYNIATAIWGANMCNSVIFAFTSKDSFRIKLLIAWLCVATSISQGLTTAQIKTDYVLWGFISPDSAIKGNTVTNTVILFSSLVSTTSQSFLVYEIWKRSRNLLLIPIFALPPIIFQIAFSSGSLFTSSASSWNFYRKDMLLASILVNAIFNTLICAGLIITFWTRYFSVISRNESIPFVLRLILFTINANVWVVLVSISNVVMFYFFYSYTSLFALYSHMTTPVYFLTVLSFLESRSAYTMVNFKPSASNDTRMATDGSGGHRIGMGGELRFTNLSRTEIFEDYRTAVR